MKKYFLGIIGGIIGGTIASIPWLITYVYGGWILSILATLIALGVNFGYRKFKGEVDNKLPVIISVLSVVIVVMITLVAMPLLSLAKEGYEASFANLNILYESKDFLSAIIWDLVIALVFAVLGIKSVIKKVSLEIK